MPVETPSDLVARRYFKRLEETLLNRFPGVPTPATPLDCTLDEFYLAIRKLNLAHELPGLGINFGYRIRLSDYGLVGLATASTRRLSEAIETQLRFLNIITNTNKINYQFYQESKWMVLKVQQLGAVRAPDQFLMEAELSAQVRFVGDLLPSAKLSSCLLNLPYPRPTLRSHYSNLGGCQVKFNQNEASFKFPYAWADRPLESADELLAPLLAQRCQLIIARMNKSDDWVLKVRNYLLTCDFPGKSLIETAYALGVTVPTLRWHLYKSNTSYKQIILAIRMELACQYLEDTPLTLQQIGYQLGYSQPANFQLAFKKYFKMPPGLWRNSRESPQDRQPEYRRSRPSIQQE